MNNERAAVISEIERVLLNYDLGELYDVERNDRGYNNISYAIQTIINDEIKKYFFRQYKLGIQHSEIEFEHSVINHLIDKEFSLVARVFETRQGPTYSAMFLEGEFNSPIFYAIFDFLDGEDKYTWIDPKCSELEIKNAARVLAEFHNAVADITCIGERFEPKILDLLPQISQNVLTSLKKSKSTKFDEYLAEHKQLILDNCLATQESLNSSISSEWPEIVIHCDYHPGNLKFRGEEVVGLFDFDWSKVDLRCFDFALACWYFFSGWKDEQDGVLRLDGFHLFLEVYQAALADLPHLDPLNKSEIEHLGMMISAGNLYVLNWTIQDFYQIEADVDEYLVYLRHSINFMRWFEKFGLDSIQKSLV